MEPELSTMIAMAAPSPSSPEGVYFAVACCAIARVLSALTRAPCRARCRDPERTATKAAISRMKRAAALLRPALARRPSWRLESRLSTWNSFSEGTQIIRPQVLPGYSKVRWPLYVPLEQELTIDDA